MVLSRRMARDMWPPSDLVCSWLLELGFVCLIARGRHVWLQVWPLHSILWALLSSIVPLIEIVDVMSWRAASSPRSLLPVPISH